ncbi:hypothetical protein [Pelomonas sp. Root1444]|uniref:hypothetical protein n=1 Tax=Pelomonas sp. Root1444 TaxID=1736464 RepID=UPI0012F84E59|nr:hypothetical protein [Pelomonas sp. Root1444]
MNSRTRCQGCGAKLPSAEAVCAHCEAELVTETPKPVGKYACPHCNGRFAKPAQVRWPPKVPWWRPAMERMQCPHCDTPLRDRRQPDIHRGFIPLMLIAVLSIQILVADRTLRSWLGFLLVLGSLSYFFWRTERGVVERDRYAAGSSRRFATGGTEQPGVAQQRQSDSPD